MSDQAPNPTLHKEERVNWVPLDDDPFAWGETYDYVAAVCFPYDPRYSKQGNQHRVGEYEVWLYRLGKLPPADTDPYEEPF